MVRDAPSEGSGHERDVTQNLIVQIVAMKERRKLRVVHDLVVEEDDGRFDRRLPAQAFVKRYHAIMERTAPGQVSATEFVGVVVCYDGAFARAKKEQRQPGFDALHERSRAECDATRADTEVRAKRRVLAEVLRQRGETSRARATATTAARSRIPSEGAAS